MICNLKNNELCLILETEGLTIKEFWYLWNMYCDDASSSEAMYRYISKCKDTLTVEELNKLIEKKFIKRGAGVLIDKNNYNQFVNGKSMLGTLAYVHDDFEITASFANKLWVKASIAGKELWEAYPNNLLINGNLAPAKAADQERLFKQYMLNIGSNKKLHEDVIKIVKSFGEYAPVGIDKFINGKMWETLKPVESSSYGTKEL